MGTSQSPFRRVFSLLGILFLLAGFLPQGVQVALAVSPDIVISQVYGGGGNSGGVYTNDFVELFNRGTTPVSLNGWSVQYASATSSGNFGSNPIALLSGTLQPGQYYLVQEAAGTSCNGSPCGASLPLADASGTANMSGTGGKVALIMSTTGLACNGGSTPCSTDQLALIKDLIGWDGANFYETAAAPATTNTTSDSRANNGCVETDNNAADFTAGVPTPHNTASAFHYCTGPSNPTGVGASTPNALFAGDPTLLTVVVTPGNFPSSTGLSVTCDLTAIGGSVSQVFYDDGTNGDVTAGDFTFSFFMFVRSGSVGS